VLHPERTVGDDHLSSIKKRKRPLLYNTGPNHDYSPKDARDLFPQMGDKASRLLLGAIRRIAAEGFAAMPLHFEIYQTAECRVQSKQDRRGIAQISR
jgi:hypothetical protein